MQQILSQGEKSQFIIAEHYKWFARLRTVERDRKGKVIWFLFFPIYLALECKEWFNVQ